MLTQLYTELQNLALNLMGKENILGTECPHPEGTTNGGKFLLSTLRVSNLT